MGLFMVIWLGEKKKREEEKERSHKQTRSPKEAESASFL